MPDPLASLLIPTARQDSDGTVAEAFVIPGSPFQHRLGSGLSPAYPSGMPLVPHGAAPLAAPAAPTAGAAQTVGNLTNNGDYQWAVTLVTKFGETTPSTVLHIAGIGVGKLGQAINIPAATGTSANPVLMRRIYRTLAGGSQLYLVVEVDDSTVSSYVDETDDTRLVTAAPGSNTSGLEGAVTITGAATTWVEQPPGTTLTTGGFIVDYTLTSTGGTITFYSGDAGKSITVTYSGATLLGSTYFNAIQTGLNLTHDKLQDVAAIYGTFPNPNTGHGVQSSWTAGTSGDIAGSEMCLVGSRFLALPVINGTTHKLGIYDTWGVGSIKVGEVSLGTAAGSGVSNAPVACVAYGQYVIVAAPGASSTSPIYVVDVSNPAVPVLKATMQDATAGSATGRVTAGLAVYEHYLLVTSKAGTAGLDVWGIEDPTAPYYAFRLSMPTTAAKRLTVQGKYAFVCSTSTPTGFVIFDLPAAFANIGGYTAPTYTDINYNYSDVCISGRYAWTAINASGMVGTDISNPTTPTGNTVVSLPAHAQRIYPMGRYLAITTQSAVNDLIIADVVNPSSVVLTTVSLSIAPSAVLVQGRRVYIGATTGTSPLLGYDLDQLEMSGVQAGSIETGQLHVQNDASVAGTLQAGRVDAGPGGISTTGLISGLLTRGVRQIRWGGQGGDFDMSSAYQSTSSLARVDWGSLENVPCTVNITTPGGTYLLVYVSATLINRLISTGNWTTLGISVDGGQVQTIGHAVTVSANTWYDAPLSGATVYGPIASAGTHTVEVVYQNGGPGGANPSASIQAGSQPAAAAFIVAVVEFAL